MGRDVSSFKVEMINHGRSPIVEPGREGLIGKAVALGRLRATTQAAQAVKDSELSLICVGSPANGNGSQDLEHVKSVCEEIGAALRGQQGYHVVVLRSTVLPGSTEVAFGGSCLGKDLRAILYQAKMVDLYLPVLSSILPSNEHQVRLAVELIRETGRKRVGLLGLAFKEDTDDLRESPLVALAETLLGKGYRVRILDRKVSLARLYGANKNYIEQEIPHISTLICESVKELVESSEVLVIGDKSEDARAALAMAGADQVIVDLVGVAGSLPPHLLASYRGICW